MYSVLAVKELVYFMWREENSDFIYFEPKQNVGYDMLENILQHKRNCV